MQYWGFLDFEFNQGWNDYHPEIISIGCCIIDSNFNEVGKFYSMVKPKLHQKIHYYVSKVTKIKQKDIDNAPDFCEVSNDFHNFLQDYQDNITFFCYGNSDWFPICFTCETNGYYLMKQDIKELINFQENILDNFVYGEFPLWETQKNLETISRFYNIKILDAHNALNDAIMLKDVFVQSKIRGKYDFQTNRFENMDSVTEEDIIIANNIAYTQREHEISMLAKGIIHRFKLQNKSHKVSCLLDGNLYCHIKYFLSTELFTRKKNRKYERYILSCFINDKNSSYDFTVTDSLSDEKQEFSIMIKSKNEKMAKTIIKMMIKKSEK